AFAAQNPLDGRIPQLLFEVGQTYFTEKKYDEAIAAWETLAGKFPGSEPAGHAQFSIAWIFENDKGDPATAIERYRKVAVEPWHTQANQRIAIMEAKSLSVVTERAFRSGETPRLKIATRNLEKLTFTAYKLDPETYFRKKHALRGVEALDISLVAPDAEWTADVPKYARFKPIETSYELKKLAMPGVYVVKVSDEKALQATTLVLGSDLDAIVKTSREQILVFAQDMKTGMGRAGARVLVSDESGLVLDARTGKDGVLVRNWETPLPPGQGAAEAAPRPPAQPAPIPPPATEVVARMPRGTLAYLVLDGGDVAGSGLAVPEKVAQGLSARAYLYTDRPAYRPGNDVELRGVVREVVDGQYANVPGATYWLEVYDSRGRKLVNRALKLSEFGTFHEAITLDDGAPVGSYRIRLTQPGKSEFAGAFEVQAYQLEKIDLAFDLPRTVYYRGETIKGTLVARYQYGTPLANRAIAVQLPDGRTLSGQTDAAGRYAFELETTGFSEEQALRLVATLPQDNVAVAAAVMLAVREFRIDLNTTRDVYLDGEGFVLNATTLNAQGEPIGQTLSVAVLKRVERNNQISERETSKEVLTTDKKTGKGAIRLKVEDEDGGTYVVRASGTDRFGNVVLAERMLTISGKKDATKLRILTDRTTFKVGESAEVRLVNRGPAGTALLTWEADRVLSYKVVPIKEGDNALTWDVDGKQFPNFTLAASRMAPSAFHEARLDVRVERDLRVSITPKVPNVGPGGEVEVEVATTDQNGRPVAAELSIALVDRSLLRLFADKLPTIDRFFYDQSRTSSFATESSATFRYNPATVPVPEAVVEEAAQQAAKQADAGRLADAKQSAGSLAFHDGPPEPAAASSPAAGGEMAARRKAGAAGGNRGFAAAAKADIQDKTKALGEALETAVDAEGFEEFQQKSGDGKDSKSVERLSRSRSGTALGRRVLFSDGTDRGAAPRERFVETAYWNPAVVTGKDGKATVKFTAPAALSDYRFTARGVSGAETLVGQATADLAVRKDFFVDLKAPAALTQGDKPRFAAEVHHKGVVGA
ncbi:MAG: large extracellular alpha-helical protein, partial [Planctomycetota bacterium]|nr:large extracellular alpha-helical protein [Planctomycetota bacterium]